MSKYIEQTSDKELIIKTDLEISNNLRNAKNELAIDKNKYNILEYTKDYMNDLISTIDNVNNNWNNLLDIAILYHDELNYKDEVDYTGVKNSIEYNPEPVETHGTVNTSSDYLNVRSSPNGEIISSLPPGSEVKILEGEKDGWTKISYGDKEAYVCSRYVTSDVPLKSIGTKTVNTANLNVRNFPNGHIINTIPYNTKVQVLSESKNGWTKVLFDNRIAFLDSKYLK